MTGCGSVRALRGMGADEKEPDVVAPNADGQRSASDVVVPNVVSTTFAEIKASGVCEAFHGAN